MSRRQEEREYARALEAATDPILRRLIRARYQQRRRGYLRIKDQDAHYLYDLGLTPYPRHPTDQPHNLPHVIHTRTPPGTWGRAEEELGCTVRQRLGDGPHRESLEQVQRGQCAARP
ncbi:hypothetical protein [Deinococcus sedimenti]|uniref:Uncharacterized protein n=1 Tax=Deinococcus sedimenti TaxID=1867090 RepID=A0ABQ2SAE4_9DEIO|nr:hypothetical protein [Deinococcus sedimenti]GGS06795.1 hypothetical protein GCM10008960_36500 [Deinococcus sedimenti]